MSAVTLPDPASATLPEFTASQAALDAAIYACISGVASYSFAIINPVGGVIFGAIEGLTSNVSTAVLDRYLQTDSITLRIAKFMLTFIASNMAASLVATILGFPMTFTAAISLTAAMLLTYFVLDNIYHASISCFPCCFPNNIGQPNGT